jgi:hypothetical protein
MVQRNGYGHNTTDVATLYWAGMPEMTFRVKKSFYTFIAPALFSLKETIKVRLHLIQIRPTD